MQGILREIGKSSAMKLKRGFNGRYYEVGELEE
jgi:hypothetical protein